VAQRTHAAQLYLADDIHHTSQRSLVDPFHRRTVLIDQYVWLQRSPYLLETVVNKIQLLILSQPWPHRETTSLVSMSISVLASTKHTDRPGLSRPVIIAALTAFIAPLLFSLIVFRSVALVDKNPKNVRQVSFVWAKDTAEERHDAGGTRKAMGNELSRAPPIVVRPGGTGQVFDAEGKDENAAPMLKPDLTLCKPGHEVEQVSNAAVGCYPLSNIPQNSVSVDLKALAGPAECSRACKSEEGAFIAVCCGYAPLCQYLFCPACRTNADRLSGSQFS